jgi:protein SCO1/2
MERMQTASLARLLLFGLGSLAAGAAALEYDRDDALQHSQAAIGQTVDTRVLRDVEGNNFDMSQLRGRPLVVSMIYTSCHHVCPTITQSLGRSVDIGNEALGDDAYNVVTIGFDWAVDTPEQMRLYAAERRIDEPNWHFLAGDEASINRLSEDLGFAFYASAKGFDHLTQTTILDREGRVYRQVYGVDFEPPALVEPLKELVFDTPRQAGLVEHWVDTFRLFCTVYDPNVGRYKFDYSIATTIFVGLLCLGAIATFIIREWRHAK